MSAATLYATEGEAIAAGVRDPWLVKDERSDSPTFGEWGYMEWTGPVSNRYKLPAWRLERAYIDVHGVETIFSASTQAGEPRLGAYEKITPETDLSLAQSGVVWNVERVVILLPLDPDPWTTKGFRGLGRSQEHWDGPAVFDPRPGYSQNREDYPA